MSENIASALRVFLLTDTGVNTLVGTRVFAVELPASEAASMPRQCVVIKPSGGPAFQPGSYIDHAFQTLDVFSYGETPFEAEAVRDAVNDALRLLRRGAINTTLIHWVQPAGGWASNRDPDADWPFGFQSFQAFYALDAAA
jgi:hypothetical protein